MIVYFRNRCKDEECPRKINADEQIFVVFVLGVFKWLEDFLYFFFKKANTEMLKISRIHLSDVMT